MSIDVPGKHVDGTVRFGELDRIGEQIEEDLLAGPFVGDEFRQAQLDCHA